jgi:hypothetical protein
MTYVQVKSFRFNQKNYDLNIPLYCPALSVVSSLKTAYEAMDTHYDTLATSLARFRANATPSSQLL